MARVKRGFKLRRRHKKILKLAKGYRGSRSRLYRMAVQVVRNGLLYAYRDRRVKKRNFRKLWIQRINAASRMYGMPYSKFTFGLKKAGVEVNRKMLAELAVHDMEGFKSIAMMALKALA